MNSHLLAMLLTASLYHQYPNHFYQYIRYYTLHHDYILKRIFQAIRIEVNGELEILKNAVCDIVKRLKKGGRLSIITFHSLEDRIIKQVFQELAKGCTCPPNFPVCVCGKKPEIKVITRKPVLPGALELSENSRSKSAKLRIAEKL